MKKSIRWGAVLATSALVFAACGDAPDDSSSEEPASEAPASETGTTESEMMSESEMTESEMMSESEMTESEATSSETAAAGDGSDVSACMLTDTGGVDDRSFNQTSYEGIVQAEEDLGISSQLLESNSEADYEPNMNTFTSGDCTLIVPVGFALDPVTAAAAEANPEQKFAIVDVDFFDFEAGEDVTFDNVTELTFRTSEAAFLAGYVAAGMTETGTVGTYGGMPFPTVTIFMDGFLAGVRHHNAEKGTAVEVLGWDGNPDSGQFTGNFESQEDGRNITDQMLAEGADIIMPVAGPVGLGSAAALRESSADDYLIWVDTDGYESASEYSDLMLTSVEKKMDVAVYDAIASVVDDSFEGGLYTGTLENEGVGIAPFHDFEDQVPDELKTELETLREGIISGELSVASEDYDA